MRDYGLEDSESEVYILEQVFIFRKICEVVNLLNVFYHQAFPFLSIYFEHHSLTFLNSFLNILNKYNVLVLNKYNFE